MSVVAIERIVDGELASADSASIIIENAAGVEVVPTTVVPPVSEGVYSYTTSALAPGVYTAIWTFTTLDATDDVVARPFVVDQPLVYTEGVTLADIERLVARRCGSYRRVRASTSGSSSTSIGSLRLRSTQNLGSFETEFALRRGYYYDGSAIPNFNEDDRVRGLDTYTAATGSITVDRDYTLMPQQDESVELLYLDPEEELRPAVLEGLKQCYFWDEVTVSYDGLGADLSLTGVVPWITNPAQVSRMQYGLLGSRVPPNRIMWWEPYRVGGSVYIRSMGVMAGNVQITALRPVSSYVNGEVSMTGPNDDLDILHVDPEYAAWAAVRQIWIDNPERVAPIAASGMRPDRDEVAAQYTLYSHRLVDQIPEFVTHRWDSVADVGIIGNLPEPRL